MNEPDLNQWTRFQLPPLPPQLLLMLAATAGSVLVAGTAFGFSDQNADLRIGAQDQREHLRALQRARARAAGSAASAVLVARADLPAQKHARPSRSSASAPAPTPVDTRERVQ